MPSGGGPKMSSTMGSSAIVFTYAEEEYLVCHVCLLKTNNDAKLNENALSTNRLRSSQSCTFGHIGHLRVPLSKVLDDVLRALHMS